MPVLMTAFLYASPAGFRLVIPDRLVPGGDEVTVMHDDLRMALCSGRPRTHRNGSETPG